MQISMILRGWQAAQSFSHTFYWLAFTFPSTMRMPGGQRRHGRVLCAADTWSPYLHVTFTLLSVVTEQWSISEQTHFITYIALNETTVETNNLSYSLKCTNHKLLIHYTEGYYCWWYGLLTVFSDFFFSVEKRGRLSSPIPAVTGWN